MTSRKKETLAAVCFLLPNILGFFLFTFWPVVAAFLLSFTQWDLLTPPHWTGLTNFSDLLGFSHSPEGWRASDPLFWKYLANTLFLMLGLPLTMAASLGLAIVLNKKLRFSYAYRLIFFLPSILSGVAIFYLWRWIYNPDYGLFNAALASVGISGPNWLTDVRWAKPALVIMSLWLGAGGTGMLLYLAALQAIPVDLYEAAEIDGAGKWAQFRAITWPGVMPVTFFILIMGVIAKLQGGFEMAYIMTQGGPFGATTTVGYYIYTMAYENFQMGYAAAIAWVLFVIIFAITALNWRFGSKNIST